MKLRNKLLVLGAAAALASATAGYVFAAPPAQDGTGSTPWTMHGAPSGGTGSMMGMGSGQMAGGFMGSAQVDTLKSELGITDAQEPAWTTYVQALRDAASAMRSNWQDMSKSVDKMAKMSVKDRQAFMEKMWQQGQAARNGVKAAADKLLASLDAPQKDKAQRILPGLAARGPGMMSQIGMAGHCMDQSASRDD